MPLTVTELVSRLKQTVEMGVGEQRVAGEIGSCKIAGSGHIYFTLKDATAQLQCVLYRYQAVLCRVRLREGLLVELSGKATVWEGRGSLQFITSSVREAGQGSLQQQFEALKNKLEAEGLFSPSRKKPLPAFPQSVGLITSASGAVIQDMRHRLESRAPWMHAYLLPVLVQGETAARGIARAINQWNHAGQYGLPAVDYLIIARGGGSMEDLWCFNDEHLARAIAASRLPVVSAVGHETDFTIADFVADLRAPTPTAAIELTTPDAEALDLHLQQTARNMKRHLTRALETARLRLLLITQGTMGHPLRALAPFAQKWDEQEEALRSASHARLDTAARRLERLAASLSTRNVLTGISLARSRMETFTQRLHSQSAAKLTTWRAQTETHAALIAAADPQNALDRGFALVRLPSGNLARQAKDLPPGTQLDITLASGKVQATVTSQEP